MGQQLLEREGRWGAEKGGGGVSLSCWARGLQGGGGPAAHPGNSPVRGLERPQTCGHVYPFIHSLW